MCSRVGVCVGPSLNLVPSDNEQPGSKPSRKRMGPRQEVITRFIAVAYSVQAVCSEVVLQAGGRFWRWGVRGGSTGISCIGVRGTC